MKGRNIKWKKVKMLMPHCPICGEVLGGNNSMILPYYCKCGEWVYDLKSSIFKIK